MVYINSYNGVRHYGEERVSVSRRWTDMEPPHTAQERKEEYLWKMTDEEYDRFLSERKRA